MYAIIHLRKQTLRDFHDTSYTQLYPDLFEIWRWRIYDYTCGRVRSCGMRAARGRAAAARPATPPAPASGRAARESLYVHAVLYLCYTPRPTLLHLAPLELFHTRHSDHTHAILRVGKTKRGTTLEPGPRGASQYAIKAWVMEDLCRSSERSGVGVFLAPFIRSLLASKLGLLRRLRQLLRRLLLHLLGRPCSPGLLHRCRLCLRFDHGGGGVSS